MKMTRWTLAGLFALCAAGAALSAAGPSHTPSLDDSLLLAMGPGGPGDDGAPPPESEEAGPGPDRGGMQAPPRGGFLAGLNLSADQKAKLKSLHRARRAKMLEAQDAVDDAREALKDYISSPKRGAEFEQQARALHAAVQDAERKLEDQRFESILEIRSILTDEQLKKFNLSLPKGPGRRGRPGGQGAGGPGGHGDEDPDQDQDHGPGHDQDKEG